jgi:hypothetical protein|tara:strand:+ start:261 stop:1142 length:882 start_codon:yes stop_codon:yes gene_type:complete
MKTTNQFNLPDPVFKALTNDTYTKGDSNRSITTLIDSPRIRIQRSELSEVIYEDVSEKIWSILGTAVHNIFEDHAEGDYLSEERLFVDINGWKVSGAIDIQKTEDDGSVTIMDYKCTSVWSVIFDKVEWHNQLNAYAYLVRKAKKVKVNKLQIVAVLRDWKKREAQMKDDYPYAPIMIVDVPLWDESVAAEYVEGRVKLHQDAEFSRLVGEELPLCSDKERWMRDAKFAVRKKTVKRAVRLFDSLEDAEKFFQKEGFGDAYVIEERVGEPIRCAQNYCRVAEHCDQYQGGLNG